MTKLKPYPKYKDSGIAWIGAVPEGWAVKRIKNVILQNKNGIKIGPFGSALKNRTLPDGEYKIYNQAHVIGDNFDLNRHFVDEATFKELLAYEVEPCDILLTMMGTIGKCKIMPNGKKRGIMDSHLIKVKLGKNILPRFFEYSYDKDNSYIGIFQLQYNSVGITMSGLNSEIVKNVYFSLPSLPEQQAIAAYLDSETAQIDVLIAKKTRSIELLREKRQAMITHAVTKGLNPNAKMKDSGIEWIGDVPEGWEVIPFFSAASESKINNKGMVEDNLLSLSYGNIVRRNINTNEGLLPESFETYQIVEKDNIVFRLTDLQNDQRSLRSAIVKERGIITSAYIAVSIKHAYMPDFFNYLFRAYDALKVFYGMGAGLRQSLKYDDLKRISVLAPPLPEQQTIAAYLDDNCAKIDTLITKTERSIELLKEKRQALISAAVTGKIDVREDAPEAVCC